MQSVSRSIASGWRDAGQQDSAALDLTDIVHRRHLAVHRLLGMHDAPAKGRADRLVAEADAEQRDLARELADRRQRKCRLPARTPGRDDQILRFGRAISASEMASLRSLHILPELAEVLDDVVGRKS